MTDTVFPEFRYHRKFVRLDTILRLRWLAVLGQLAAIFIVAQGLEFDVPIIPCVAVIAFSAIVNLSLQIAFNPRQQLQPIYAAALLALNIRGARGAAVLHRRPAESVLVPVPGAGADLGHRADHTADAGAGAFGDRLRHGAGLRVHMPLPWNSDEPLALPPIYMTAVWLSIVLAIGVTSLYTFQVTDEASKLSDALSPPPSWCWRASSI